MWDCKHKVGRDGCLLRRCRCFPGGKLCVLNGKFDFPFRNEIDELDVKSDVVQKPEEDKQQKRKKRK